MTSSPSARQIDDEAADWAARIDGRDLDAAHEPELQAWLAGDPRRAGAFLRAQAAISLLDRGRALAGAKASDPEPRARASTRRALITGLGGAGLAAGLGAAMVWTTRPQRLDTGLGEIRRVPLADGSLVAINTHTALDVALKAGSRQVTLRRGEAWFQVAKDAHRPFVVAAGRVRVRAVGTAFSVRRRDGGADVMVTEGVVEIWVEGETGPRQRVAAGSKILLADTTAPIVAESPSEIERSLAWRNGEIALDGESLGDAAGQFNRYNSRQIVIDDPGLAQERFVGLFRTNEPESFAAAVAATIGARVSEDDKTIRLSRGPLS